MFTVIAMLIIVSGLLFSLIVVNFVLTNRAMFEATFDIVFQLPYIGWSHTWEGVQFMYIIAASMLLGALIVGIATWGLDVKRKLKMRSMRKELKRLQEALEHAKGTQQQFEEKEVLPEEKVVPVVEDEIQEVVETSTSPTPEEITESFKDTVAKSSFLNDLREEPQKDFVEEEQEDDYLITAQEKQLSPESPVEAELVEDDLPDEKKEDKKDKEGDLLNPK